MTFIQETKHRLGRVVCAGVWLGGATVLVLSGGCDDDDDDSCTRLCDRTVLCVEKHVAPHIAAENDGTRSPEDFRCTFDDEAQAQAKCASGCAEEARGPTAKACIACLADRLTCATTAAVRVCDGDCEPTMFATGTDGEGALTYDYASWFFSGVSDLEGITCEEQ
jgi:hypothetical protein